jgi:1-deoxy-D-xylulose-5-phosphate reductoisomerase
MQDKKKTISVLGVTGSIGSNVIDIIAKNPHNYKLEVIVANNNYQKLVTIAKKFQPQYVCIVNSLYYIQVKEALALYNIKILHGDKGLEEITKINVDICVSAIIGFAGFIPTINMLPYCKIMAIANKETIVCGGNLFIEECKKHQVKLLPIDSEHNSIYQLLEGKNKKEIDKIYLTASGGPFLYKTLEDLSDVTLQDALQHPNWKMGNKITIDSATMINKGLELIETYFLFQVNKEKIEVLVHPQSIIHAIISFCDGSAQSLLSAADMRVPISYILGYPDRIKQQSLLFDVNKISKLELTSPNYNRFPALRIAKDVLNDEGIMPIIFNAANEVFVKLFLEEKIKFTDIVNNVGIILNKFSNRQIESFDDICEVDKETRKISYSII